MTGRRVLAAALMCLTLAACGAESPDAAVTVTDSAGVTITLSSDYDGTYATLTPEPIVDLGGADATGPEQFYRVDNVHQDARGRLWVSDGQSGELRVFDAAGAHLFTRGGLGEGPGEFLLVRLLGAFANDSIAVADQRTGRLSIYDAEGRLTRTEQIPAGQGALPRPFDVYPDGSMLGQIPRMLMSDAIEPGTILRGDVDLARIDVGSGTRVDAGGGEGPVWLWTGRLQVPIPFTANAGFALRDEEVHFAAGPAFRVRVFEGGRVTRVYGVDRAVQEVGPDDVEAYRDLVREAYPEQQQAAYLEVLDHPLTPSVMPAYRDLVVASDGTVWVQRYQPDTDWDVFDVDGRLLGSVEAPDDFRLTSMSGERLAGVWQDELGVEYVRVYELRGGSP